MALRRIGNQQQWPPILKISNQLESAIFAPNPIRGNVCRREFDLTSRSEPPLAASFVAQRVLPNLDWTVFERPLTRPAPFPSSFNRSSRIISEHGWFVLPVPMQ